MIRSQRASRADQVRPRAFALALFGLATAAVGQSPLPPVDTFNMAGSELSVSPVQQMSVVIKTPAGVIYTDPTGGARRYAGYPEPDIILISHEHHEHYDPGTLLDLITPATRIIAPPYVMAQIPEQLRSNAVSLANGEQIDLDQFKIAALPAYGMNGAAGEWHPHGRGNGYVVTVQGQRIYVAGSTEAVPELLALRDINLALLPLYPPYALDPEAALSVVDNIRPQVTYIYQYNSVQTREDFVRMFDRSGRHGILVAHDIR